jgi:hypothetical protein
MRTQRGAMERIKGISYGEDRVFPIRADRADLTSNESFISLFYVFLCAGSGGAYGLACAGSIESAASF